MLDRILDLIADTVSSAAPYIIVKEYEQGVVLRLGKYRRSLAPGIHWTVPVIETVLVDRTVPRTANLSEQTLMTADGVAATVSAVTVARISDIRKALLEVEDVDAAWVNVCYAAIGQIVAENVWSDLSTAKLQKNMTRLCRKLALPFGVYVEKVVFDNICRAAAVRVLGMNGEQEL